MELIEFLNNNGLDGLTNIKKSFVPQKNVWILNYDQVPSVKGGFGKYHPILCLCRNLVVREEEKSQWKIMSRSFSRFFNWNEDVVTTEAFKNEMKENRVMAQEKFDGSLITVAYFDEQWNIFTRGSDADANFTYGQLSFGQRVRNLLNLEILNKDITYVFELCSPDANVTRYDSSFLAILSANINGVEIYGDELFSLELPASVRKPEVFYPSCIEEIYERLKTKTPDFEGYVLSYKEENKIFRMKIKQESYIALHHTRHGPMNVADAIQIVISNEIDEVLAYKPEYKELLEKIKSKFESVCENVDLFYKENRSLSRKDYALKIPKDAEIKWVYFDLFLGKYPCCCNAISDPENRNKLEKLFTL